MSTPSTALFASHRLWEIVFLASFVCWTFMEKWLRSRDREASGEAKDQGSFGVLLFLIPAGMVGAFIAAYGSPATRIAARADAVFWSGIALIWLGMALRAWAVLTLGRFFRLTVFVHEDHHLITHGPYRWLRNPGYAGSLVTAVGFGLALGNWLSLLLAAGAMFAAFGWRITVEEKALRERFGQAYADYARRSWALIPPIW